MDVISTINEENENEKYINQIEGIDYEYIPQNIEDIYPIDELLIRTETRTVFDIKRRIDSKYYILNPSFQRDFVWDEKKQSKLIESALMRLPLPVFYFAETEEGKIITHIRQELKFVNDSRTLKTQMEQKIKEIINRVWGKPTK